MAPNKIFYGIDAPYVICSLYIGGVIVLLIVGGTMYGFWVPALFFKTSLLSYFSLSPLAQWWVYAPPLFIIPTWMLYSSLRGKYIQRDALLKTIAWNGAEQVLDVGCGRGLLLIGAAKLLTTGKAYGIDIWSTQDLSQNSKRSTEENALLEGVKERVIILTQDVCNMTFQESKFDVVMTSLVIHNISSQNRRKAALTEMVRVCKPGGTILIQDFQYIDEYAAILNKLGMKNVTISARSWHMFPPVRIVSCIKP